MSIINCPRCSDSFDSDQHTEPLCKTCMGKVETEDMSAKLDRPFWVAMLDGRPGYGGGRTEDEAIAALITMQFGLEEAI